MPIRRYTTKSRSGHWTLTLIDPETGRRAHSAKHATKHGALAEEDELMLILRARAIEPTDDQFMAALGPCGK